MVDEASALDPIVLRNSSAFPGNALGSTWMPDQEDPTKSQSVGGANSDPSLWSKFYGRASSVVTWPFHAVASAYDVVTSAPGNAIKFVKDQEEKAVSAATGVAQGVGSVLKYVAVAMALVAVAYLVAVFAPALKGKK